jgi:hypothetical protein
VDEKISDAENLDNLLQELKMFIQKAGKKHHKKKK